MMYHGMFDISNYVLGGNILQKKALQLPCTGLHGKLLDFMGDKDQLCSDIAIRGQQYVNGDLLVLEMQDCDEAKIGMISAIVVKEGKVFFLCSAYRCIRNWLQFFESVSKEDSDLFVEHSFLKDYKPLIRRGTSDKFIFVMLHRISIQYV